MKRHYLLVAGCLLGAVSAGLNIYLYSLRHSPPAKESAETPAAAAPSAGSSAAGGSKEYPSAGPLPAPIEGESSSLKAFPGAPLSKFDFSDTAFADGSWKLTDPETAVKLDKPFLWEDVDPEKRKADPDNPFGVAELPEKKPAIQERYVESPPIPANTVPSPPLPAK